MHSRLIECLLGQVAELKERNNALRGNRGLKVVPLSGELGAKVLGCDLAEVHNDEKLWLKIQELFANYSLLVFSGQSHLTPEQQSCFVRLFDPAAKTVWRDQRTNAWELLKAEKMGGAGTYQLPHNPDVLVLGKGEVVDHHGLTATLGGARKAYGKDSGSQVLGGGSLQFHIDGAFYKSHPPRVSGMYCVEAPDGPPHTIAYEDGSRASIAVPLGSTAFASAYKCYDGLSEEVKRKAMGAVVYYLPHPFRVTKDCSTTKNGLRMTAALGFDKTADEELSAAAGDPDLKCYPLVWTHPVTRKKAFMPHTRCLHHIRFRDDSTLVGDAARRWLEPLMRPAVEPALVYAHDYKAGDLVVWDNLCVWHSATGGLQERHRRVMHLISFDGSMAPAE